MSKEDFNIKWMGISILIFALSEVVVRILFFIFALLTLGLGGLLSFLIRPLVYFLGGIITGFLSPGITLKEPAVGAVIAVVIGNLIKRGDDNLFFIILFAVIAFACALAGAKIGEKLQGNKVD